MIQFLKRLARLIGLPELIHIESKRSHDHRIIPGDASTLQRQPCAAQNESLQSQTELAHSEELRVEAQRRMEMIVNSITDRFFLIDREWRYTYFNKHAEEQLRALGKNPAAMLGKVLWDEFPNATSAVQLRRAMADRTMVTHEHYCAPIGEWLENRIYPSPDGGLAIFQASVTERKEAEAQLRRTAAYLTQGQRLSHTASWAWDTSSGDLYWSEEHFRIFGLDPRTTKPSYPWVFQCVYAEDRQHVQETFDAAVRDQRDHELSFRIVRPNGELRHIHSVAHPVINELDQHLEYVGTIIDITERRNAEEALTRAVVEINALKDRLAQEKLYLEEEIRTDHGFDEIIGESELLQRVFRQVQSVAPTDSTVLIQGETGTGKELIARAIHSRSRRRDHTFVKISCAAIPAGLLESELFGHERGAFTGAVARKIGRFELAHGGTLFLDEVGEIPLELQSKLLHVLQEHSFERVGSTRSIHVDVRIIAATNRDLEQMAADHEFRQDLYYRLKVFPITTSPLRERPGDIPALVHHFTRKYARQMNKSITAIPTQTIQALCQYSWPGNIRELENFIERSVILSHGEALQAPIAELKHVPKAVSAVTLVEVERDHIRRALEAANWVIGGPTGAAAKLGIKRTTLNYRMQKLGIERPKQ